MIAPSNYSCAKTALVAGPDFEMKILKKLLEFGML